MIDLALHATNGLQNRSLHGRVSVTQRHLWLNLTDIPEKEKAFLLEATHSRSRLFSDALSNVISKFSTVKQQLAAFGK